MSRPETRTAGCNRPSAENTKENTAIIVEMGDARRAFAIMQGRAEECGCTLHELSDGFLVGKWNLSLAVPDLRAVGNLLRQIGGAP